MELKKLQPFRSKKLLAGSEGEKCVKCGSYEGVVAAHYTGFRQHAYGKGRGIKCSDLMSAYLCRGCHKYFDEYMEIVYKKIALGTEPDDYFIVCLSEEFLHCIALTNIRRVDKGLLR